LLVGSDPCPISPGPLVPLSRAGGQWHDHSPRSDPLVPWSRSGALLCLPGHRQARKGEL